LKSVFEKIRFRDGLVLTVGLTVEINLRFLSFYNFTFFTVKMHGW